MRIPPANYGTGLNLCPALLENAGSETIPAYSIVEIVSRDTSRDSTSTWMLPSAILVRQVTSDERPPGRPLASTGALEIAVGETGPGLIGAHLVCSVSGATNGGDTRASVTSGSFTPTADMVGELEIINFGSAACLVRQGGGGTGSACKIFRAPALGIAAATWSEVDDELTVTSAQCQEYIWNEDSTKLIPSVTVEIIDEVPTDVPVTYSVANPFRGRVPGSICIPTGFTEDAEVCEDDPLPEVPELDPPCDYDVRVMEPYFFMAVKNGIHYIPSDPLMPTKRVHVLQRPQLHEDEYGVRTLQFPLYEVRLPVPIHDGCEPLPFAVCGPAGAAVPCE